MTWEQYWHEDAAMVKIFRKAHKLKNRRDNQQMWMLGAYVYHAILDASPILHAFAKPGTTANPYLAEPFAIDREETREREVRKVREAAEKFKQFVAMKNLERKEKEPNSDYDRRTGTPDQG